MQADFPQFVDPGDHQVLTAPRLLRCDGQMRIWALQVSTTFWHRQRPLESLEDIVSATFQAFSSNSLVRNLLLGPT